MKISKSLLQAIAIGLSLSAITSSCTKDFFEAEPSPEFNDESTMEQQKQNSKDPLGVCPSGSSDEPFVCGLCGMG
jgi:hypothetical protein